MLGRKLENNTYSSTMSFGLERLPRKEKHLALDESLENPNILELVDVGP